MSNAQRWRLVGLGVLVSAASVFILLLGINDQGNGVLLEIAGAFTTLVTVPLTLFLLYGAIRLRHPLISEAKPMPLFRRKTDPALSRLLTCLVFAKADIWEGSWMSDNTRKEPPEFEAASLTEAVDQAAAAARELWSTLPPVPGAELDFAIYPWRYGKNGAIYDISGKSGDFTARDIQGSDREVRAASLEGLVEALGREPAGDIAMLRWRRPFAELPTDALES
jgi:hypothetical protein